MTQLEGLEGSTWGCLLDLGTRVRRLDLCSITLPFKRKLLALQLAYSPSLQGMIGQEPGQ
eukprot:3766377-Amphidinium_carterae.2